MVVQPELTVGSRGHGEAAVAGARLPRMTTGTAHAVPWVKVRRLRLLSVRSPVDGVASSATGTA